MGVHQLERISPAEQLRGLLARADISYEDFAKAMGYAGASSVQRYMNPNEYKKPFLPVDFAQRAAVVLAGHGSPPIDEAEVLALAGLPEPEAPDLGLLIGLLDICDRSLQAIQTSLDLAHNRYAQEIEQIRVLRREIRALRSKFQKAR